MKGIVFCIVLLTMAGCQSNKQMPKPELEDSTLLESGEYVLIYDLVTGKTIPMKCCIDDGYTKISESGDSLYFIEEENKWVLYEEFARYYNIGDE